LYYHFASKERLVATYLERRDRASRALLEGAARASRSHAEAALAVFDALERWFRTREFRGCALTNAVGEGGETVIVAGPITRRHKLAIRAWFVQTCTAAQAREPVALGEMLMLLFDGALTSATTRRSPAIAARAREAAALLMQAHGLKV
jgi:AcrR family transcriptional regulator